MSTTVKTIADCLNVAAAKVFTFSEDRSVAVCLLSVLCAVASCVFFVAYLH